MARLYTVFECYSVGRQAGLLQMNTVEMFFAITVHQDTVEGGGSLLRV